MHCHSVPGSTCLWTDPPRWLVPWWWHTALSSWCLWVHPWSWWLGICPDTSDPESSSQSLHCWHHWKVDIPCWWASAIHIKGWSHSMQADTAAINQHPNGTPDSAKYCDGDVKPLWMFQLYNGERLYQVYKHSTQSEVCLSGIERTIWWLIGSPWGPWVRRWSQRGRWDQSRPPWQLSQCISLRS